MHDSVVLDNSVVHTDFIFYYVSEFVFIALDSEKIVLI